MRLARFDPGSAPWPLIALATLFALASVTYGVVWMYHVRVQPTAFLGIDYDYIGPVSGVRISSVGRGTPAERVGLKAGDHIIAVNGHPVKSRGPIYDAVDRGKPGDQPVLIVIREGTADPVTLRPTLGPVRIPSTTLMHRAMMEVIFAYPLLWLMVALTVLFQRIDDRNAWLLALLCAGFIASAPLFEPQLPPRLRNFEVAYFFGAAENSREINPAIYIPGASTVGNTQARRPYKDYSRIGLYESTNITKYDSMQLNAEKRFGTGLSVVASYTFSKKKDDYGWTTPDDRSFDYGLSREDVPHNFKFSNVWQLPHIRGNRTLTALLNGWMLNSMVTWQSGFPFTVSSGRDNSFTGIGRDRADFLGGDANLGSDRPHGEMVARYFDTSKFAVNAIGTFGNSAKNMLRGPRYFNTDFALLKVTTIREAIGVQFRAELFNLFNNVNFNAPNSNVSSAQFGRITSALDPRIIQFGVKMLF